MAALEKHYTPAEVAEAWGLSEQAITRLFAEEPGTVRIELPRLVSRWHPKTKLRIPESVLARVYEQRLAGFAGEIRRKYGTYTTMRTIERRKAEFVASQQRLLDGAE